MVMGFVSRQAGDSRQPGRGAAMALQL